MTESAFDGFEITDDDPNAETTSLSYDSTESEPKDSPFTIVYDSLEQKPYTFEHIIGDYRDDYAPIRVKTLKKRLKVGDYSIQGLESIVIERKSKEDLFSSVANGAKRENFIERLRKMQSTLKYGAVVVECYKQDLFDAPPVHTSLNPKTVYRTSLSWGIQFPLVHWHFCRDREESEQLVFRLLEKFWEHETSIKYRHHNKPIDANIDAFELGIISRKSANEIEAVYCKDNPLRLSWERGWDFYSTHFLGGDRGVIYEKGQTPPSEVSAALASIKAKKSKSIEDGYQRKPIKGQQVLPIVEGEPSGGPMTIDELFGPAAEPKSKRRKT